MELFEIEAGGTYWLATRDGFYPGEDWTDLAHPRDPWVRRRRRRGLDVLSYLLLGQSPRPWLPSTVRQPNNCPVQVVSLARYRGWSMWLRWWAIHPRGSFLLARVVDGGPPLYVKPEHLRGVWDPERRTVLYRDPALV